MSSKGIFFLFIISLIIPVLIQGISKNRSKRQLCGCQLSQKSLISQCPCSQEPKIDASYGCNTKNDKQTTYPCIFSGNLKNKDILVTLRQCIDSCQSTCQNNCLNSGNILNKNECPFSCGGSCSNTCVKIVTSKVIVSPTTTTTTTTTTSSYPIIDDTTTFLIHIQRTACESGCTFKCNNNLQCKNICFQECFCEMTCQKSCTKIEILDFSDICVPKCYNYCYLSTTTTTTPIQEQTTRKQETSLMVGINICQNNCISQCTSVNSYFYCQSNCKEKCNCQRSCEDRCQFKENKFLISFCQRDCTNKCNYKVSKPIICNDQCVNQCQEKTDININGCISICHVACVLRLPPPPPTTTTTTTTTTTPISVIYIYYVCVNRCKDNCSDNCHTLSNNICLPNCNNLCINICQNQK